MDCLRGAQLSGSQWLVKIMAPERPVTAGSIAIENGHRNSGFTHE